MGVHTQIFGPIDHHAMPFNINKSAYSAQDLWSTLQYNPLPPPPHPTPHPLVYEQAYSAK